MKKYFFVFTYLRKRRIIILVFLMLFSSLMALCPPYIISFILDNGVVKMSPNIIIGGGALLICIYVVSFVVNYFISQTLTKTSNYFIANLKNDLFTKILKLPMEFFDKQQTGYILERIKEADTLNVFFSPVFLRSRYKRVSFSVSPHKTLVSLLKRTTVASLTIPSVLGPIGPGSGGSITGLIGS